MKLAALLFFAAAITTSSALAEHYTLQVWSTPYPWHTPYLQETSGLDKATCLERGESWKFLSQGWRDKLNEDVEFRCAPTP